MESAPVPPRNDAAHSAVHPPWRLRRESAVFVGTKPIAANLLPLAGDMLDWLRQKGQLSIVTEHQRGKTYSFTNPYTYSGSSLAVQLGGAINDIADFSSNDQALDSMEAEFRRIRLESELILQFSRFCEAVIKQMLYCTNLHDRLYKRAALGRLLAFDCRPCRKANKPHYVSMLGALAHHYFECHVIEHCLFDHLAFVGNRRSEESAHSDSATPRFLDAGASREQAKRRLDEVGRELGHMCQHLGTIERKMIAEIDVFIRHAPNSPPHDELARIPVRLSDVFPKDEVAGSTEASRGPERP